MPLNLLRVVCTTQLAVDMWSLYRESSEFCQE